jgi:hypothetical protein
MLAKFFDGVGRLQAERLVKRPTVLLQTQSDGIPGNTIHTPHGD